MDWLIQAAHAAGESVAQASVRAIDWLTWLWVIGISVLGGGVSFFQKLKRGQVRPFNFTELLGEILVSFFVGLVTFLLCRAIDLNDYWSAGLTGITAHMGSRALMLMEDAFTKKFQKMTGE